MHRNCIDYFSLTILPVELSKWFFLGFSYSGSWGWLLRSTSLKRRFKFTDGNITRFLGNRCHFFERGCWMKHLHFPIGFRSRTDLTFKRSSLALRFALPTWFYIDSLRLLVLISLVDLHLGLINSLSCCKKTQLSCLDYLGCLGRLVLFLASGNKSTWLRVIINF